jgi:hypothetical protein
MSKKHYEQYELMKKNLRTLVAYWQGRAQVSQSMWDWFAFRQCAEDVQTVLLDGGRTLTDMEDLLCLIGGDEANEVEVALSDVRKGEHHDQLVMKAEWARRLLSECARVDAMPSQGNSRESHASVANARCST